MNIIGKPSAIGDLSAIFAAAEVNRCSSPAISPAAAAPMSEVIDRTKVKKSPTAAINGRRRMLDPHNVRAATRDKRPPAKNRGPSRTANAGQRKANVANRAGRANVANRAGIRPGQGRANFANRGGINRGMGGLRAQAGGLRIGGGGLGGRGFGGGGRGFGGGGRGFGGGRGGARRSDIRLKHDIVLVDRLTNGLGLYRFSYNGSNKAYIGVMAQEVQQVMPEAVTRDTDGYLG